MEKNVRSVLGEESWLNFQINSIKPHSDSKEHQLQGSHSLEKALNFEGCLEKALNYMAGPEKPLNLLWTALNICIEGPKFIFESIWSDKS